MRWPETVRDRRPAIVVMLLTVDDFTEVNARGRTAVEDAVVHLASRLRECAPVDSILARIGDDGFAVLVVGTPSRMSLSDLANHVSSGVSGPALLRGVEGMVALSATLGFVVAAADESLAAATLLRQAESAMCRARTGGLPWAGYDRSLDTAAMQRLNTIDDLREAIAGTQLEMHYQPVIDLISDEIVSVEALIRWRHPTRGLIGPTDFIPLAEASGLIGPLNEWVATAVIQQSRAWAALGRPVRCAVNLSMHGLTDPDNGDRLLGIMAGSGGLVTVELTESALADSRTVGFLRRLAELGVHTAIDDFGTGFSCLSALKNLPVTALKIDRSFVRDVAHDDRDAAIVTMILQLAWTLGLDVIAEGIETEEAAAGCARAESAGVRVTCTRIRCRRPNSISG